MEVRHELPKSLRPLGTQTLTLPTSHRRSPHSMTCSCRSLVSRRLGSSMQIISDTWTMTKRNLRHIVRSMDTIITVVIMPIALMLLFLSVFGGAPGHQTGGVQYVDFITPGIIIMTVVSGIAYAAVRLSMDLQKGIINRFRTMPVAPSSILGGQAASSTLSNLFS